MTENKKIVKFELSTESLKIKKALSKDFLIVEMQAISSACPNRNNSCFTKPSMDRSINSFYNKPVLASFNKDIDDFGAHDGEFKYDLELGNPYFDYTDPNSETPIGMIRQEDKVVIKYHDDDGLYWIHFTCALWVKYSYRQVKRLLKRGSNKISVEIEVLSSHIVDGIEYIDEFLFDGVTLLGSAVKEGIAGAHLNIIDTINNATFQKKQKCLSFAYNELNTNIGTNDANGKNQTPDFGILRSDDDDFDREFNIQSREDLIRYFADSCDSDCVEGSFESKEPTDINENIDEINMIEKGGNLEMNTENKVQNNAESEDFACKMNNACEDCENKETEACKTCEKCTEACKEQEACREEESCKDKQEESCTDSTNCFEDDPEDKDDKDDDDNEKEEEACKETESCEDKQEEACGDKEEESCIDSTNCYEGESTMSIVSNVVVDSSAVFSENNKVDANGEVNNEAASANAFVSDNNTIDTVNTNAIVFNANESNAAQISGAINLDTVSKSEYETLKNEFETLKAQFEATMEEYNSLKAEMDKKTNQEWFSVVNDMINNETALSDEVRKNFSEEVEGKINNKEFASLDDVKKFTKTQIALALYDMSHNDMNKETENTNFSNESKEIESKNFAENSNASESKEKEFVSDINATPNTPISVSGAEKLKEARNKLNKI